MPGWQVTHGLSFKQLNFFCYKPATSHPTRSPHHSIPSALLHCVWPVLRLLLLLLQLLALQC